MINAPMIRSKLEGIDVRYSNISSSSTIKIQLIAGEEVYLTLDGQRGFQMDIDDIIEVRTSSLEFTLVSSPKRNYFDLLQEKLSWG